MLRKILIWTLLAALLAGCAPILKSPSAATLVTVDDGLGRTVKLNGPAQRIVSMAPSNTEILFAIGAGSQVVGRDDFSDYPDAVKALPKVGGTDKYNNEEIVALHPDLVLAAEINTADQVKTLEGLGLTVYYLKNPNSLEDMYKNLETIAKLSGHEPEAEKLITSLKSRVAAVDGKIATTTSHPSVFYEIDATDPAKPFTAGPGTFIDLLIQRAGGINIAGTLKDQYPQLSLEQVVALNPSFLLLGDAVYGATPDVVKARPGWGSLSAVKNGNVVAVDDNIFSRPGPRLIDGLELLAKILHPELFK